MQHENITEYKLIRKEMLNLKDCITNYIGFVLGGSGAAVFVLFSISGPSASVFGKAYTALVISTIISLVLMILIYKFNSHNRFAAYCKLLNHERYELPVDFNSNELLLSWEITVERLRYSDINDQWLINLAKKGIEAKELDEKKLVKLLEKYTGKKADVDNKKLRKGVWLLPKTILGRAVSKSWGFPPFVVAIFFLLCFGFFIVGLYETYEVIRLNSIEGTDQIILGLFAIFILIIQTSLWWRYFGKLHTLMKGSATVSGFFIRYLPIRIRFLNSYGIIPRFYYVNERLDEIIGELDSPGDGDSQ